MQSYFVATRQNCYLNTSGVIVYRYASGQHRVSL